MEEITRYNLCYLGVKCVGVIWEHQIFYFLKNKKYIFLNKNIIYTQTQISTT